MKEGENRVVKYGNSINRHIHDRGRNWNRQTERWGEETKRARRNITVPKTKGRSENRLSEQERSDMQIRETEKQGRVNEINRKVT
jgi:hypothetical protein